MGGKHNPTMGGKDGAAIDNNLRIVIPIDNAKNTIIIICEWTVYYDYPRYKISRYPFLKIPRITVKIIFPVFLLLGTPIQQHPHLSMVAITSW